MKKFIKYFFIAIAQLVLIFHFQINLKAQKIPIAFPGAEGFGKFTTGGRGGRVYIVTNLNDSGPGSLREAVEAIGPRTVVFEISGNIALLSPLNLRNSDITIAGQTAPGDGITLQNYPLRMIRVDNIIIRFMRFRLGDLPGKENDSMEGRFCRNVILDHCSFSWGTDETASFYANENFSLQWSIISEGLNKSVHPKGEHGYGGIAGGKNASFHHNLIANFTERLLRFDHPGSYGSQENLFRFRGIVDFRNNVIYNWRTRASSGGEAGSFNIINNYYKPGPSEKQKSFFLRPDGGDWDYGKFFVRGNILENNPKVNGDNWLGVRLETTALTNKFLESTKALSPFPTIIDSHEIQRRLNPRDLTSESLNVYDSNYDSETAYQRVLNFSGANLYRDEVDSRIIHETRTGTYTFEGSNGSTGGIIDSQKDVGGWPILKSTEAPKDIDRDGMPDDWEIANGLDPNKSDGRWYHLHPFYTNLEVYVNSLVEHIIDQKK